MFSFNLKDGIFQGKFHPASRECTAIGTVFGLLQYKKLPQEPKKSPGTFQRILNSILGDRKGVDILAFLYDTSIGTITEEEHLTSLSAILDTLLLAGMELKLSKCSFMVRTAEILGHVVNHTGLRPSDSIYSLSVSWPSPPQEMS